MPSKTKTKADVEKELKEALSALKELKDAPSGGPVDLSWLGEKVEKRTAYFLERLCDKRKADPERVIVACLAYCATLSHKRHGLHLIAQEIERVAGCRI